MASDTIKSAKPAAATSRTTAADKSQAARTPTKRVAPAARPVRKQAPASSKPAATATRKAAPRKAAAPKPAAAVKPASTAKPLAAKKTVKPVKAKKAKLVRDSFTMPETEYAVIASLKKRCLGAGVSAKKSEILRAAIAGLARLSDASVAAAIRRLEVIKTGRPAKAAK
jgi:hypothetical protein